MPLIPGSTVVVTETKVPSGYVLNTTPQMITVKNGSRLGFLDHYGSGDAIDADFTFVIGGVETVAAEMPVVIVNVAAVGVGGL